MTRILDGDWRVLLENQYLWARVSEQKLADGEVFRYDYKLNGRDLFEAIVTLPTGEKQMVFVP